MKPVAVLGIGPAGLMAAHAVAVSGKPVALFGAPDDNGNPKKSKLGGAQFLHAGIPYINSDIPDTHVTFRVVGTQDIYRRKVYGDDGADISKIPFVSFENVYDGMVQPAWNLQRTYDALWDTLSAERANVEHVDVDWVQKMLDADEFQAIVSSIPLPSICRSHHGYGNEIHNFFSQRIWIKDECIMEALPDETIMYDGTLEHSWYRCNRMFNFGGTEWSQDRPKPPYKDLVTATKPLWTGCNCWEGSVIRVGRFGEWKKGVLTHDAYTKARLEFAG